MNERIEQVVSDKRRKEIIDGKIYMMATPSDKHIRIQLNLCYIFNNYFNQSKRRCTAVFAKDLYINDKNWLVPDTLVYCKSNNEKKKKNIPLIVVEVLSDSTWKKDITVKMKKYAELEIEQYWIIDPDTQRLTIYKLENGKYEEPGALYNLPVENSYSPLLEDEEDAVIKEFSPDFFPELTIHLEDIFNFENLDIL